MLQLSKHVEWCLRKAEKELEECKKLGKGPKHKGLLKIESNINEAKRHIKKAEHNLKAVDNFEKSGFSDWSITAGFYCVYHCFLAIASKFGYESGNQTCTIALIEYLKEERKINIDQKFTEMFKYKDEKEEKESIIGMREDFTYGTKVKIEKEKIGDIIKTCKEIIDITKTIIYE